MIPIPADPGRVRVATSLDEVALIDHAQQAHAELLLAHPAFGEFSIEKSRALIQRAYSPGCNQPIVIGIVGELRVEGSVCLIPETHLLSDSPFFRLAWCVVPSEFRRGTTHQRDLLDFATQWTRPLPGGLGLPVIAEVASTYKTEGKTRLFERQFGEPVVSTWVYSTEMQGR